MNTVKKLTFKNLILNFSKSLYNHFLNLFRHVSKKEASRRLNICKECKYYTPDTSRCKECGCYLLIKTKWKSEDCPIHKWDIN